MTACSSTIATDDASLDRASMSDARDAVDRVEHDVEALDASEDAATDSEADAREPDAATVDAAAPRDVVADTRAMADTGAPTPAPTSALLLNGRDPMPCADPTLFSERNNNAVYFVYCTSMAHVWRTSDWVTFSDERRRTDFDLTGMSANGREIGSWWAPGVIFVPELDRYVMWVSVPAASATRTMDGWNARAMAVLTATTPTGPWVFREMAQTAAVGEHYIDPFLFRDSDGRRFVYWKQYGGGLSSSIMGAQVSADWRSIVAGTRVEIMNGYGGAGTWEDNVRENPAVYRDPGTNRYHMLFSGGHWDDGTYATGHALSTCGPLCVAAPDGYRMVSSGDRGILQVVRAFGDADFAHGGPGGAEFQDGAARFIVYAAAARSARGDRTRFLMRDRIQWRNNAPFVDTAGHRPLGF
ncbi:MAG: family 43 glycosylhydrolase [Myxococcales bacterium]|nr:family 43 glycosylhydrolase [Myxococcales bacterium]